MKNLAIHAVIVLLALACFADAFRLQSKVKSTLNTKQEEEYEYQACSECTGRCASFVWPEPTPEAQMLCANSEGYKYCCNDFCSDVCPPYACFYGVYNQCAMNGYYPF